MKREAELHLIRSRGTEGLRHKAARGELRQNLPFDLGYRSGHAPVIITADEAVRGVDRHGSRRLAALGSARAVLYPLSRDGLLLSRRPGEYDAGRNASAPARFPAVHDLLTNPAYAAASCSAARPAKNTWTPPARLLVTSVRLLPREQRAVLIPRSSPRIHQPGNL